MYRYILFDMDDTLLDFGVAEEMSFRKVMEHFGEPFDRQNYERYSAINLGLWHQLELGEITRTQVLQRRYARFFETLGRKVDGAEANAVFLEALSEQAALIPGALEVCRRLSQTHTLVIVTNGMALEQQKRLNKSGLAPYFRHVVISETVGIPKPQVGFFEAAYRMIGCDDPQQMLMIGDSLSSDILGANRVGMDACWFNSKGKEPDRPVKIAYTIRTLEEILPIAEA